MDTMLQYTIYTNMFRVDETAIKELEMRAEKGEPEALFALGRYHYCTNSQHNSMDMAKEYLLKAQACGVDEADVALATMYRRGFMGVVDRQKAEELIQNAAQRGCRYAIETLVSDMIYGLYGKTIDLSGAIKWLNELLNEGEHPMWYSLMGCALLQNNELTEASKWFAKATEKGIIDAYSDLAYTLSHDEEGELIDKAAYITTLKRGADMRDGVSTLLLALCKMERYEDAGMYEQLFLIKEFMINLEQSVAQGCNSAAYYLGNIYLEGNYGIKSDYRKAWKWFVRGSELLSSDCYECMYDMMEKRLVEGVSITPDMCALNGARCGSERLSNCVVDAYRNGRLKEYATEIEQCYMNH